MSGEAFSPETQDFTTKVHFQACDGNLPVLAQSTGDYNMALNTLLSDIKSGIADLTRVSGDVAAASDRLQQNRASFMQIDERAFGENYLKIARQFGETPGIVLVPSGQDMSGQDMFRWISAVRAQDGTVLRLMHGRSNVDAQEYAERLSMIGPRTIGRMIDGHGIYASEFLFDAVAPPRITEDQRKEWLERVRESGLDFHLDVASDDPYLDNFVIDNEGRLRYIDGSMVAFPEAPDGATMDAVVRDQFETLDPFVNQAPEERTPPAPSTPREGNWWE